MTKAHVCHQSVCSSTLGHFGQSIGRFQEALSEGDSVPARFADHCRLRPPYQCGSDAVSVCHPDNGATNRLLIA